MGTDSISRQVSVAEVERSHLVLHSMCMRAWAEDSLSVADTQSRIMALTANEERVTDQVSKFLYEYGLSPVKFCLIWTIYLRIHWFVQVWICKIFFRLWRQQKGHRVSSLNFLRQEQM